jgi:hypothetical protein
MKSLRVQMVLLLFIIGILSGCAKADPYAGLSMEVDWESIEMTQETYNKQNTITKFYVTLRNSGKEPVYLDSKFWFEIVTVEDQDKQKLVKDSFSLETSLIEAEEISFLSLNSWESVSGVFEVVEPYTESTFLVAADLPINTFLTSVELYDSQRTSKKIDWATLYFCPDSKGATRNNFNLKKGEKCDDGKVVSFTDN